MEAPKQTHRRKEPTLRQLGEQALSRASGAPLLQGNSVRILCDAADNFPAWLDAIRAAKRTVHFENYIWDDDPVGRKFIAALADAAARGVRVRVTWDWLGSRRRTDAAFWRPLVEAGGEVRCINPLRFDSPLGWLRRDHRKTATVDGCVGFVSGLCISADWLGAPEKDVSPWRDTGVEIRGPAVAGIEQAFAELWGAHGPPLPEDELTDPESIAEEGEVALRVVATAPDTAGLFRLDQLIAAMARERLWLTDAYFVGSAPYVQALAAAAADGVDIRLLVPGATDLPIVKQFTRSGYRALLEAGIRVFEWNGTMLHAKTAVADGRWARIGSTNLNLASWIGNWELDVAIEDPGIAARMEDIYLADLENATEIILERRRLRPVSQPPRSERRGRFRHVHGRASGRRATAGAMRFATRIGAAVSDKRPLEAMESRSIGWVGLAILVLSVLTLLWPAILGWPLAVVGLWFGGGLLARGFRKERSDLPAVSRLESDRRE